MTSFYDRARTETLTVNDEQLSLTFAVIPGGPGAQFILLHGNPSHLNSWHLTVPALLPYGSVCVMDLPGFGRSQTPAHGVMSLDKMADATLAVADAVGFDKPVIVGNSFGGAVAQTYAARHPTRVTALVLLATIGTPANPVIAMTRIPFAEAVSSFVAHRMTAWPLKGLGQRWSVYNAKMNCAPDDVPPGFAEADFDMVVRRPEIQGNSVRANVKDPTKQLVAQASNIKVPVRMIHPEGDRVVPMVYATNLFEVFKAHGLDVTLTTVPGGHIAHQAQAPAVNAKLVEAVRPFTAPANRSDALR